MLTRYWLEEQRQSESFKNERIIGNSKLVPEFEKKMRVINGQSCEEHML